MWGCVRWEIWWVLPSEDHTVQLPDSLWGDSVIQEKFHYYSKQGKGVGVWGKVCKVGDMVGIAQ